MRQVQRLAPVAAVAMVIWLAGGQAAGVLRFVAADAGRSGDFPQTYPPLAALALVGLVWLAVRGGAGRVLIGAALLVALTGTLLNVFVVVQQVRGGPGTAPAAAYAAGLVAAIAALILPGLSVLALARVFGHSGSRRALPAAPDAPGERVPTWPTDQAAGAHWQTAGAAATGAAASLRGRPGERGGWTTADTPAGTQLAQKGTPAHDPRGPEQFGPRAIAQQYGNSAASPTSAAEAGSAPRQPPRWAPMDRPEQVDPPL